MFGGKLGDLDAYVPAAVNAGGAGGGTGESALAWIKDDYKAALERARSEGKLLFVNFTGVACANCHWMEANMLSRPEVAGVLKGFVLVELFTDRADAVSQSNGDLQLAKFQTAATPFYAILDANEKVVATYAGKTGDATEYLAFLNKGAGAVPAATAASAAAAAPAAVSGSTGAGLKYVALDGKPVETAGKVVVLNFWATWCVPCLQEIPSFNKLHKEFSPKGVAVIGVSMDEEGAARVQPFLKKHPMQYAVALTSPEISQQYGVGDELPITVVLDRSGKEVKRFTGFTAENEIQAAVQAAL
jgi:thiol:disulfide interchange protein DsbD